MPTVTTAFASSSDRQLKESLAVFELEFTEFKELMQVRLNGSPYDSIRQLPEGLQQLKKNNQTTISELRGTIKEESKALWAQITKSERWRHKQGEIPPKRNKVDERANGGKAHFNGSHILTTLRALLTATLWQSHTDLTGDASHWFKTG